MSTLRAWCFRLTGLFDKERKDRELAEELDSHLQMHVEDNLRAGMSPAEARRDALLKLGGVEQTKEKYRARRGIPFLESLWQDLRFGIRMLRKNSGFTTVAVLTLALGIGANTAIFSVVNGLLLRPLPVRDPEQITTLAARRAGTGMFLFSYPAYLDFKDQNTSFSDLFGYILDVAGFSVDGKANEAVVEDITGNYFPALGLKPALGRLIGPDDDRQGIGANIVLGYSFWQKRFGGNQAVIGKQVLLNGKPATIVGVAPKRYRGAYLFVDDDAFVPLHAASPADTSRADWLNDRKAARLWVLGRLKPGIPLAQAQSSLVIISSRLASQYPLSDGGVMVNVYPEARARPNPNIGDLEKLAAISFLVLAFFVLLLACLNVTNILLARATTRHRELAIRAAIGSSGGRLIRQMLTETVLLVALGAIAGILLGEWASSAISSLPLDQNMPVALDFSFDWRVFVYAFASAGFAAFAAGLWPAIRASRTNLNAALREEGRTDSASSARGRLRSGLVIAEIAGSLVLLIVAGLFVRSLRAVESSYLGFDPDHVLNVLLNPQEIGYDQAHSTEFYRRLKDDISGLPGISSVSIAYSVPMGTYNTTRFVYIEGRPVVPYKDQPSAFFNRIDESYIDTMRVPLLRGRGFTKSDDAKAPLVAIINQDMSDHFWPGQDPIGKRFSAGNASGPFLQVIGVVGNGKYTFIAEPPQPYFYVPQAQDFTARRAIEIRSLVNTESLIPQVQQKIAAIDSNMPISQIESMNQSLQGGNGLFIFRMASSMATAMGIVGLTLAVVGIYGVVSYSTSQRTREIGIRMSLGAMPRQILGLVLKQGTVFAAAGILLGLALAFLASRVVMHLLFGVSATDPLTYFAAAFALGGVAFLACYIPARRATKVDPMVALRYE